MLGKIEGKKKKKKKRVAEDEMVRQHHQLNGHEFQQTPGDNEGQMNVACYSPRIHKGLDPTWQLKNNKINK